MRISARIKIQGETPFLHHSFNISVLDGSQQKKGIAAGNNPSEWKTSVLSDENDNLYIRPDYLIGSLRDGGKKIKVSRSNISRTIASTLRIKEPILLIKDCFLPEGWNTSSFIFPTDPEKKVYLDIRGVKNPATRGRNVRYRVACTPGWEIEATISWDDTLLSSNSVEAALIEAGNHAGLGDGREIGFGRFKTISFDLLDA